jgi:hypothetical protein
MPGSQAKKPSPIFPTATDFGLHTITEYGSQNEAHGVIKSQIYANGGGGKIHINAPVKSEVTWQINSANEKTVILKFKETIGIFKENDRMTFGPIADNYDLNKLPRQVEKGTEVGQTEDTKVRVVMNPDGPTDITVTTNGTISPRKFVDFSLGNADENGNPVANDSTGTPTDAVVQPGGDAVDVGAIAKAAAFSTFFSMPGFVNTMESNSLTGQRSLMNDTPLMPFIQQLSMACLRQFMSTPNGDFFAFYPDYFGGLGKTAYWLIEDIEIISGSIELSDDQLYTHVYVIGDIAGAPSGADTGSGSVGFEDRLNTGGVVNVFNAFMADFLNGVDVKGDLKAVDPKKYPTLAKKEDAINFLRKYGARPHYEEAAMVRAPIYEAFLAYQKFCLYWSGQFKTQFQFTFMPELFPGGIVAFPEHGLQCYVNSVTHNCSYENGFTTTAELMAPSAYKNTDGTAADPDKAWVHAGMIRSWPTTDPVGTFSNATDKDPSEADKKK